MTSIVSQKYFKLTNALYTKNIPTDVIRRIVSYDSQDAHQRASQQHNKNICIEIHEMFIAVRLKENMELIKKKLQYFLNRLPFNHDEAPVDNVLGKSMSTFTIHEHDLKHQELFTFPQYRYAIESIIEKDFPQSHMKFSHICCSGKGIVFQQRISINRITNHYDNVLNNMIERINNEEEDA